ncbi:tetratricopeptide repeat protein [Cryptosporangium minutisporangium]|uniref:TIR domain-containing protein n=1 Tax=Cryptosporangium minutisporangium TaxID=113569 RepID=A0ABP6T0T7_9ACTN
MAAFGDASAAGETDGRVWDVALSFAGAQRPYVEQVAAVLKASGVRCFYDADEQLTLWGKFLPEELSDLYAYRAAAVVVFVSAEYAAGDWTRLERRAALDRAVRDRAERVLPARFDDTALPGLLAGLVTVDLREVEPRTFAHLLIEKLATLGVLGTGPPPGAATTRPAPVIANLPPRNPVFTGRGELLGAIERSFAEQPVAVATVRGMGGIGKTQTALEFAYQGRQGGRYTLTWWVRAESDLTLLEDLAGLAPALGTTSDQDLEFTVTEVCRRLETLSNWLLVFDDVREARVVRPWLPAGAGHVLITSRDRSWQRTATTLDIDLFTREESTSYLLRIAGTPSDSGTRAAADSLAAELGDLPLALAQAAAYVETHGLSIGGYLALYREQAGAGRLLAERIEDYPHRVATTWLIHYTALAADQPAALELLSLCAWLETDNVDLDLLLGRPEVLEGALAGELARRAATASGREELIGALVRTGLVTRLDDVRLRIHQLVAQVTRERLVEHDPEIAAAWANHALDLVYELLPDEPWKHQNWPGALELAAHATTIMGHLERAGWTPTINAGPVLGMLGQYLEARADYETAHRYLERALTIVEAMYGPQHPWVAATLGNLGNVQLQLGWLDAARASHERALRIKETTYGVEHPRVAVTLGNLGLVQQQLGELEAARATHDRAHVIFAKAWGLDHPDAVWVRGLRAELR